uniref:Uncharacterized protein n=1 Tax=Scophthalmus maximus TaxID=52904 RepID=A0A8D3DM23_SCOMX
MNPSDCATGRRPATRSHSDDVPPLGAESERRRTSEDEKIDGRETRSSGGRGGYWRTPVGGARELGTIGSTSVTPVFCVLTSRGLLLLFL